MNILFFTHRFLPDIGGVELSVFCIARELVNLGHRVQIITETKEKYQPAMDSGIVVVPISVRKSRPFTRLSFWKWMWDRRSMLRKADVLHFHDYGTFLHWFFPLRFLIRKPVYALTYHGFDSWPIKMKDRFFRSLSSFFMNVRYGAGEYIGRIYSHRVDYYYIGASIRSPGRITSVRNCDFLYVGRIAPDTDIVDFLECLDVVTRNMHIHCNMTIIGDGELRERIVEKEFPFINLRLCDASLNLRKEMEDTTYIIATGFLSLLDAFHFRKPALVPAYTEIKKKYFASIPYLDEMAFYVTDTDSTQEALTQILKHPDNEMIESKVACAHEFAGTLSWNKIAETYLHGYLNLSDKKGYQ